MSSFIGFPAGKVHLTPIPATFFSELLPRINNLWELKITLYALWFLDRQEGNVRYVIYQDFLEDKKLMEGLGLEPEAALAEGLEGAVLRGSLLKVKAEGEPEQNVFYFLNSPRGRAAVEALRRGEWTPDSELHVTAELSVDRPNIFRLYEENIGPLTPMIAEMLRDAEKNYSEDWIEEAIGLAVKKNVRNWRYIEGILRSWQEKGRNAQNQRDSEENRRRYIEGEFADFIEH